MAIGGFNGSDPSPTLAQFQAWVARREDPLLHRRRRGPRRRLRGGLGGGTERQRTGGSGTASQITPWVESTFTARTVDGVTVYDLTSS